MTPLLTSTSSLREGEVGYLCGAIREIRDVKIGDTVILEREHDARSEVPLTGYTVPKPLVYCNLFSSDADDYELLRNSLSKLSLSDSSLVYAPVNSATLGSGFQCGFLGLLHVSFRCALSLKTLSGIAHVLRWK